MTHKRVTKPGDIGAVAEVLGWDPQGNVHHDLLQAGHYEYVEKAQEAFSRIKKELSALRAANKHEKQKYDELYRMTEGYINKLHETEKQQDKAQAALIDSALIQAKLLEERDEARATLAFLQSEYGKAEDETLTRDALELKIRLLEQQLSAIRKAVYDLRVLRSSCEDSYDGEFRVHLIEDQYNALIKLASE